MELSLKNESLFKRHLHTKRSESMTKTGLNSTGEKPRSSHSSLNVWEMVRRAKNFELDIKPNQWKS